MPVPKLSGGGSVLMQRCSLYAHTSAILDEHHIIPKSWYPPGAPVDSPMQPGLCPNCHMDVHAAIDGALRGNSLDLLPPRAVRLARLGIKLATAAGLPMKPTL